MMSNLLGNPHSASLPSQYTTSRIEDIRLKLMRFLNADPADFDLIFVANATAGVKLVSEAFRAMPHGFAFAYHEACHTSIIGIREEAHDSICVDDTDVERWISGEACFNAASAPDVLFSYTAQSHMDGRRYPLDWPARLRQSVASPSHGHFYTMLDAASFGATSPMDLSDASSAPDFTVLSLYKIFGFPDLGALIVRKQAEPVFNCRRYFGGGTVDMVVCGKEQWHSPKAAFLHERLEDGTLPFHNILALDAALDTHGELFESMARVASHTAFLANRLYEGLTALRHGNGRPVCNIYSRRDEAGIRDAGPLVAFNLMNSSGTWVSTHEFEKLAMLKGIHLRTGGVCSPGGIASALGLEPWEVRRNFSSGFRCGSEQDIVAGKPTGIIRASLGAMSTIADVEFFLAFIDEFYREETGMEPTDNNECTSAGNLEVQGINVFPIKSCGGYPVPLGAAWEVKPEGLAWDREWCLIHQGSGHALSQKRYPKMALLKPVLDFNHGLMRVTYHGNIPPHLPSEISVPLSADPAQYVTKGSSRARSSRVCGDNITALVYSAPAINSFFSDILGVPCVLARFPAGGQGLGMRHSKAKLQKHQQAETTIPKVCPGAFPELPSPPDSDSEQPAGRILLSNESPILLINTASLHALNREIMATGGALVSSDAFRANIVVGSKVPEPESTTDSLAWAEDSWKSLKIGVHDFKLMGSCRRCQMVCVDQGSGERNQEPFVTLAKIRRFDGKVYFGTHMGHDPPTNSATKHGQFPTITVGDSVQVEARV